MRKKDLGQFISPIIVLLILAVAFILSNSFATDAAGGLNPAFYPRILILVTLVLTIPLLVTETMKIKKTETEPVIDELQQIEDKKELRRELKVTLSFMVLILLYYLGLKILGFLIATPLMLLGGMKLLNYDNNKFALLVTAGCTLIVYFGFTYLLNVRFPSGIFF